MFRLQKISNYGTSIPAVARTALQGRELLQFFDQPEPQKTAAMAVLFELQRHLVKCVEIRDDLATEISAGRDQFAADGSKPQVRGNALALPGVGDLQSKAETFLQSAKLALAETGNLTKPFYDVAHGHKYQKFSAWADTQFGAADDFTVLVKSWEPFVRRVVQMRNAVDHPLTEPGAPLRTANFDITLGDGTPELVDPTWGLTGEAFRPMLPDFETIIDKSIVLGENVLIRLFYKLRGSPLVEIQEIPMEERDPSNPRRLTVRLAGQ